MTVFEYAVCLATFFAILFTGIEIGELFSLFSLILNCDYSFVILYQSHQE